jgi:hypothetical protein
VTRAVKNLIMGGLIASKIGYLLITQKDDAVL